MGEGFIPASTPLGILLPTLVMRPQGTKGSRDYLIAAMELQGPPAASCGQEGRVLGLFQSILRISPPVHHEITVRLP